MMVAEIADSTVDITPAVIRSPWLSVSDMLIANKCWLCMAPFQRGYKKKVFMVSQLALCLMQRRKEELACTEGSAEGSAEGSKWELPPIESKNFRACYEMFLQLDGDEANLTNDLKKHDVAEWLSGLACCRSEICEEEYSLLVPAKESSDGTAAKSARVVRKFTPAIDPNCPPDCGCDNPWPFLSA